MVAVGTERLHIGPRDHVVQFYGHDTELIGGAGEYLRAAMTEEAAGVVIATPEHRSALSRWLADAGIDLSSARAQGRYLDVDAEETAGRLMVDGRPDRVRFDEVVGGLVRAAARGGRPVRAFGEMVAVLWNSGLVNAAIELESLWNELARQYQFSLFCAYPVTEDQPFDALNAICLLHGKVVGVLDGGFAFEAREFELTKEAPALARRFAVAAAGRLRGPVYRGLAEDVAIVVTELAANAVLHARTGFTVALSRHEDAVRVSVRDSGPLASLSPQPMHGLGVVDALARTWGILPFSDYGKAVWAELIPPPATLAPRVAVVASPRPRPAASRARPRAAPKHARQIRFVGHVSGSCGGGVTGSLLRRKIGP